MLKVGDKVMAKKRKWYGKTSYFVGDETKKGIIVAKYPDFVVVQYELRI